MQAFMFPSTAAALLAQSRSYTERKRREKAEQQEIKAAFRQFERIGFNAEQAFELAVIHIRGVQS